MGVQIGPLDLGTRVAPGAAIARSLLLGSAIDRLAARSWSDGLTGLANRRRFDQALAEEWRRAARHEAPVAVLIIDLDDFKAYNDSYGHRQGDRCLRQVAELLGGRVRRAGDLAGRYGGEEFVLLLPNTEMPGLGNFAEQLRTQIEELQLAHAGSRVSSWVTISVGAAWLVPAIGMSAADLVARADDALYQAKGLGRNRVAIAALRGTGSPVALVGETASEDGGLKAAQHGSDDPPLTPGSAGVG